MTGKINKAFTLIELLVVVAIIGILAAVGVVAYNGYTAAAKEKVCIHNYKLLSKLISEKYALCELEQTIKLKGQYWKNIPGTEYNYTCGGSISSMANAVLKHFTNFAEDPYNPDFHGNVEVLTWSGTPYKDGMIALHGTRVRTRCRGKQYETTIQ